MGKRAEALRIGCHRSPTPPTTLFLSFLYHGNVLAPSSQVLLSFPLYCE